jgi:MFS family permease
MRLPDFSIFQHGAFARFWAFRFASVLGFQIQATALGWQIYDISRDAGRSIGDAAFLLGLVGLFQFVPLLLLSLIGGQAADRYDRRIILLCTSAARAVVTASLLIVPTLPANAAIAWILGVAAATGALSAFSPAAATAILSQLVPRAALPQAIALNSLAFTTGAVIGPALGGVLYGFGAQTAYGAALGLIAVAFTTLAFTRTPRHEPATGGAHALALIRDGLMYVRGNRIVLGAISLDLVVVLLAGAQAMLPVFARDVLHAGPEGLGVLRACPAAGAALVGLAMAAAPLRQNVGRWMFAGVLVYAAAIIVFGLSQLFWVTAAALFVSGASDMISVYVRQSLIQLATPDAMRGRVAAISFICVSASNELGDFEAGVMARLFGPVASVALGGSLGFGAALAWMRLFPQLAKADAFTDVLPDSEREQPRPAADGARAPS